MEGRNLIVMKNNFTNIYDAVKEILISYPETRSNDHLLYIIYFEEILCKSFNRRTFIEQQQSFATIERLRRKVQREFPELRDERTYNKRKDLQDEFYEYFSRVG